MQHECHDASGMSRHLAAPELRQIRRCVFTYVRACTCLDASKAAFPATPQNSCDSLFMGNQLLGSHQNAWLGLPNSWMKLAGTKTAFMILSAHYRVSGGCARTPHHSPFRCHESSHRKRAHDDDTDAISRIRSNTLPGCPLGFHT